MSHDPQNTPIKDFVVKQGATFSRVIKFRDKSTGELQSLDGLESASLIARPDDASDNIEVITDGPEDSNIVIDKPNKKIIVFIAASLTADYAWALADYRFEVTDSSGSVWRRLRGNLILEKKTA